jgi:hypothetical protein
MARETPDTPLGRGEHAELVAFADGRLGARRRAEVEARVAASPALKEALAGQRAAIAAARSADVMAPPALRARLHAMRRQAIPRRRRFRIAVGGVAAAAVTATAVVAALTFPGQVSRDPTIVQAAELSLSPATRPAPGHDSERDKLLEDSGAGVSYPYWEDDFGWRATGARTDRLGDRRVTTVFYARAGRRIGYSIVDGPRLPPPVATKDKVVRSVRLRSFVANGRQVVTWIRAGRTCILAARGVDVEEMFALAGWRGEGQVGI